MLASRDNSTSSFVSSQAGYGWAIPSPYYGFQGVNQQTEYGKAWQPPTRPFTGSDMSHRISKHNSNGASAFYFKQQQPDTYRSQWNPNLIELSTQQFEETKTENSSTTPSAHRSQSSRPNSIQTETKSTSTYLSTDTTLGNIPPKESTKVLTKVKHLKVNKIVFRNAGCYRCLCMKFNEANGF